MNNNIVAESGVAGYIKERRIEPEETTHDWVFAGGKKRENF